MGLDFPSAMNMTYKTAHDPWGQNDRTCCHLPHDECSRLWSSANILTVSDSVCFHLCSQGRDLQEPLQAYKC